MVVDAREVVAILDARRLGRTADARALLARAGGGASGDPAPKAVVVTLRGIHPAPVSAAAIARRLETLREAAVEKRLRDRQDVASGR